MSTDLIMTLSRKGTPLTTNILVQMDNLSIQEAAYYGGAAPYYRYSGYTLFSNVDFQLGDLLTDQQHTDPRTNTNVVYRIINQPEFFPDLHVELVLDKVVGT